MNTLRDYEPVAGSEVIEELRLVAEKAKVLTVSEALWKAKPVVASAVGGITLQIAHKYSGLLCHSVEGAAHAIKQLLQNPAYAKRLGENGREHIHQNFLVTRHLRDYLLLILSMSHDSDLIYL